MASRPASRVPRARLQHEHAALESFGGHPRVHFALLILVAALDEHLPTFGNLGRGFPSILRSRFARCLIGSLGCSHARRLAAGWLGECRECEPRIKGRCRACSLRPQRGHIPQPRATPSLFYTSRERHIAPFTGPSAKRS